VLHILPTLPERSIPQGLTTTDANSMSSNKTRDALSGILEPTVTSPQFCPIDSRRDPSTRPTTRRRGEAMLNTKPIRRLVSEEKGGEVLEYALIAGLIVVAAITVIGAVGGKVLARWNSLNASM
jgi:Flp pilus assembly pilin Flp